MEWFYSFATEGLLLPAFMVAFGSLVILRGPSSPKLNEAQFGEGPRWLQWLARADSSTLQRRSGWTMIVCAIILTIVRLSTAL